MDAYLLGEPIRQSVSLKPDTHYPFERAVWTGSVYRALILTTDMIDFFRVLESMILTQLMIVLHVVFCFVIAIMFDSAMM